MQQQGRVLRAGRWFKAAVALMVATTLATADVVEDQVPSGATFSVHAEIGLDVDGGAVEFGTGSGWEDLADFNIIVDGDGYVFVNGSAIGSTAGVSDIRIDVFVDNGAMSVVVVNAWCGTMLCMESGFEAPVAAHVRARGAAIDLFQVS